MKGLFGKRLNVLPKTLRRFALNSYAFFNTSATRATGA